MHGLGILIGRHQGEDVGKTHCMRRAYRAWYKVEATSRRVLPCWTLHTVHYIPHLGVGGRCPA